MGTRNFKDPNWNALENKPQQPRTKAEAAEQKRNAKAAATARDARRALGMNQDVAQTLLQQHDEAMDLAAYLTAERGNDPALLKKVQALPVWGPPLGGTGRVAKTVVATKKHKPAPAREHLGA